MSMRRISVLALILCLLLPSLSLPALATPSTTGEPSVSAQAALLMEWESGETVFSKNADTPLPMASTTKIMTALVACELATPDTLITVDVRAVGVEGSSIYLQEGETLMLEQLLYALLLESANDAATAIAIGISGSTEAFAEEMNRKARALGLESSHFTNPHGLDDEQHYTTARELAQLTRAALQNELIRTIVSTRKATIPHDATGGNRLLVNHNKMLRFYEGCIGVKTGFTKRSGRCLVSAAERDGVTLISVTLNAPDDWNDHSAMLDYGFSRYESILLCEREQFLFPLSVVSGRDAYVMICNEGELRITLPRGHGQIFASVEVGRFAYAPIAEGEVMGRVIFRCDKNGDGQTETVGEIPLRSCYAVTKPTPKRSFWQWLLNLLGFTK